MGRRIAAVWILLYVIHEWRGPGSGHIGQGHNMHGTLCSRAATSKNFRLGTHRSGTHQPCMYCVPPNKSSWMMRPMDYASLALKKNYGTHVIRLDIAPKTYPLGQHLFISASNNMFYRHSQWDKRHTICVVNLMTQDTKIVFLNRSYLGSNLQPSGRVSTNAPHMPCTSLLKLDIFGAKYLSSFYPPHVVSKNGGNNMSWDANQWDSVMCTMHT
jgi:hypothetical protein